MNRVLSLNVAAVAALAAGAALPSLRVRENDGLLQIRPTDRTNLSNLPAGEAIVNLTTKSNARRATLPAEIASSFEGAKLELVGEPHYGWYTFARTNDLPRGRAGASIN